MPALYTRLFWWGALSGAVLLALTPWIKKLIKDAK
jgi:hypothetical protein